MFDDMFNNGERIILAEKVRLTPAIVVFKCDCGKSMASTDHDVSFIQCDICGQKMAFVPNNGKTKLARTMWDILFQSECTECFNKKASVKFGGTLGNMGSLVMSLAGGILTGVGLNLFSDEAVAREVYNALNQIILKNPSNYSQIAGIFWRNRRSKEGLKRELTPLLKQYLYQAIRQVEKEHADKIESRPGEARILNLIKEKLGDNIKNEQEEVDTKQQSTSVPSKDIDWSELDAMAASKAETQEQPATDKVPLNAVKVDCPSCGQVIYRRDQIPEGKCPLCEGNASIIDSTSPTAQPQKKTHAFCPGCSMIRDIRTSPMCPQCNVDLTQQGVSKKALSLVRVLDNNDFILKIM